MTTATKPTVEELEEKIDDLAAIIGRLTYALFGNGWREPDDCGDPALVWHVEMSDEGTEDEAPVGWWHYKGIGEDEEVRDDA